MKRLLLIALLGAAFPALAHRLPMPAGAPASYQAECASCHMAYQPGLLAADDWRRVMASLHDHFGSDATVDSKNGLEIKTFLEGNGGDARKLGNAGTPPRITQTRHFTRHHREIPARFWRDPRIKSAANCEACHRNAASSHYSEHDIAIPELRE